MKEFLKRVYDRMVQLTSAICTKKIEEDKIVIIKKFKDSNSFIDECLKKFSNIEVFTYDRMDINKAGYTYINGRLDDIFIVVPNINNAKVVIVDDYAPFLYKGNINEETQVIQIWHAIGAIKKFGLEEQGFGNYSIHEQERYKGVYSKFTKIVVASKEMAEVFKKSYGVKEDVFLYYGVAKAVKLLREDSTLSYESKRANVLYAPTFRKGQNEETITHLVKTVNNEVLKHNLTPYYRLHPKEAKQFSIKGDDIPLKDVGLLITDYSSIVWDYLLVNPEGEVLFYCPDYKVYDEENGLQDWFKKMDKSVKFSELVDALDQYKDGEFASHISVNNWNKYNSEDSINKLISYIGNYIK